MRDEVNKNGIAINEYFLIKPPLLRILHDCNVYKMKLPQHMNKAKNCYPFQEIIKIVNNRKSCPELLKYYNIIFWHWKQHIKLLIENVLPADLTDIDIVKPDHLNSYAPHVTYVFPTLPPTDTPNTIIAFLNH